MSRENVDAARRSFDGWNRGDVDAWLESAHPDIEFFSEIASRMEGAETVFRGTAEMHRFWDEWHSVWDVTIDVLELRDLGNTVLVLGRMRTRGEASGIDLEGPVAYVFELTEAWRERCVRT
jgi:ketosteroid isomerase-like protein